MATTLINDQVKSVPAMMGWGDGVCGECEVARRGVTGRRLDGGGKGWGRNDGKDVR